ncbi:MAG: DUF3488 domain-containing protein [Deltaproteobacteria bacterium]|nr:DUF3488 domain-containing protein [Deltaproteobacteria bacterium]
MNKRFLSLFRSSYHLLVLAGFLSQALTGALNPLILSLGFAALGLSFFKSRLGPSLILSRALGNTAALAALLFGLADYFFLSGDMIIASAHLLILIQTVKLFSLKNNRDYHQLYGLSFFGLISAAGLTAGLSFVFSFLFYLLMLTWTLILHHFKEELESRGMELSADPGGAPPVGGRFLATVSLVAFFSFFITLAFFYGIPRIGFGYLHSRSPDSRVSGFSKTVDLALFGPVRLDSRAVMRVELYPAQGTPQAGPLHWRAMAFDYYNGRAWESRAPFDRLLRPGSGRVFPVRERAGTGPILEQTFYMEPLGMDLVFSLPGTVAVSGDFLYVKTNRLGTIELPLSVRKRIRLSYRVRSEIALTRDGREISSPRPPEKGGSDFSLQLPEQSQSIRRLAHQVTKPFEGDYQKVEAVEKFLKENYTYSLDVERNPAYSPVEDFLFHQKKGFCEHFATAMTLMVRSLDIPARLVSGFLGGEWNGFGRYYLIREKDAHTWVEVYFPGSGWVTFDPTPPAGEEKPVFGPVKELFHFVDALRLKWNRYVINYRLRDQVAAVRLARTKGLYLGRGGRRLLAALKIRYRLWASKAPSWQKSLFLLLILLGGVGTLFLIIRQVKKPLASTKEPSRQPIRVGFYREMVRMLEARGFSRKAGTTPLEYAREVIRSGGRGYNGVLDITCLYNRQRFGGQEASPQEMARIRSMLGDLRNLIQETRGSRPASRPSRYNRNHPPPTATPL